MIISLAQISTYPGQIKSNTEKIITYINRAKNEKSDLVVFPELTIPGYAVLDLAFSNSYVIKNKQALNEIIKATDGISVIVGFIDSEPDKKRAGSRPMLYNSAAVIENGKLLGVQDKTLLPNYDIFFEDRYFSTAREIKTYKIKDQVIGVQICEDLWDEDYPVKVTEKQVELKADTIINISASPFHSQKILERQALILNLIKKHSINFYYTNLIGSFDGFEGETVFDGQSLAYNKSGDLLAQGAAFEERLITFDSNSKKFLKLTALDKDLETYNALILGIRDFFYRLKLIYKYSKEHLMDHVF